jgi:hypothetical protein
MKRSRGLVLKFLLYEEVFVMVVEVGRDESLMKEEGKVWEEDLNRSYVLILKTWEVE